MEEKYKGAPVDQRKERFVKTCYIGFALLVAVACVWVLFFSGSNIEDPEKIARRSGKTVLRIWGGVGTDTRAITTRDKIWADINAKFFREHPDIIPDSSARLRIPDSARSGALLMSLAGGSAPDVLAFKGFGAQTLLDQGFLEPLNKYMEEDLAKTPELKKGFDFPSALRPVVTRRNPETGEEELCGLLRAYGVRTLMYRTDLFREAGLDPARPPKTWKELKEYAIKLTRPEKKIEGALARRGQVGFWAEPTETFLQMTWQLGGDMVRKYKVCPQHKEEVSAAKEESLDRCPVCGADIGRVPVRWRVAWASEAGARALDTIKDLTSGPWTRVTLENGEEKVYEFTHEQVDNEETVVFDDGARFDLSDPETRENLNFGVWYITSSTSTDLGAMRMFARGELAMMIISNHEEAMLNMERGGVPFHLSSLGAPPTFEDGRPIVYIQAFMWGVNSQSTPAKKRAAYEYIKYACGDIAWQIKTRVLVENGLSFMARPHLLKDFGYDEYYKRLDPRIIEVYRTVEENARAMPWNEGWLPIWTSIVPEVVETVMQPDGYKRDSMETLEDYQELANRAALNVKDEAAYRRIRKWAWVAFAAALLLFSWAVVYISRSKYAGRAGGGMAIEVAGRKTPGYIIRQVLKAWLFLAPALLSVLVWRYIPLGWGAGMAFYDYKLIDGFASPFVGIDNFIDIFKQPLFWKVILNTLYYVGLTIGLGFIVPIVLALLLDECPRGSLAFRIIFYLPAIMSPLVTLLLWQLLYEPSSSGLLNQLLIRVGLVDANQPLRFLNSPRLAMLCIIIPGIWAHAGPGCIIYLAALKVVPEDLYEAVAVDGGGLWHKLRLVTFPALAPLVVINFIGAFIAAWQAMQNIFVLTGGGPLNATRVIGIEIWYNAFIYLRFGYATAMAWILASLLVGFTVLQLRFFSKVEFKSAQGR